MRAETSDSLFPLTANLFTDLKRTPWAGTKIGTEMKAQIDRRYQGQLIGESWELSCDPAFLSKLPSGQSLRDKIHEDPGKVLGSDYTKLFGSELKLMIKLINSNMPLSFQVHPPADFDRLRLGESSKTESWLVVASEPNSGFYLGFKDGVSEEQIRAALRAGAGELREYLQFVPVTPGDYFEIAPGVPHAIGPGVLVLEPQFVDRGAGGKTYRFWDWDRHYDENGHLDKDGVSRELHQEESFALLDLAQHSGPKLLTQVRSKGNRLAVGDHSILQFPANDFYQLQVLKLSKPEPVKLQSSDGFVFLEALRGSIELDGNRTLVPGLPLLMPASKSELLISGLGELVIVTSKATDISFQSA